jgi:uncharacterized protein (DUF2062 family)
MKKKEENRILSFFKTVYLKLFEINDSPQRIALGLGLGVFSGIMPGAGPLAALFLAWLFKVNKGSALLGSLLTNTWLSIAIFFLSIKVGAGIMGLNWQNIFNYSLIILEDFRWGDLFKISLLKIIFPVVLGYVAVALSLGFLVYLITFLLIRIRYENKGRTDLSR